MSYERFGAPHAVDLNLLGKCNLRCPFCWGPSHDQGALLDTRAWQNIIGELAQRGMQSIVLTGGEPLLRADLAEICQYARSRHLRVTLSTNGILLPKRGQAILPFVDEIGIPLDGASSLMNNALRRSPGNIDHFSGALAAIAFVNQRFPRLELTVRTVISRPNAGEIANIGALLQQMGIGGLRWKLYQFVPLGYGKEVEAELAIEPGCFQALVAHVRAAYPALRIDTLDHDAREGRYLHILPNGDAMTPTCTHDEIPLGNALDGLDAVLANLARRLDSTRNQCHGRRAESVPATPEPTLIERVIGAGLLTSPLAAEPL
jgi:Fe-coproporphyrin III synthase